MDKKSGIYKITNLINNKIYIGQAKDLRIRIRTHEKYDTPEKFNGSISFENEKQMPIHQAIMKYHLENFKIEIIEKCSISELNSKEQYWIAYYDCIAPKGYNLTKGGQIGCPLKGEKSHLNKYPEKEINKIKKLLKQGLSCYEVIELFPKINKSIIYSINSGSSWYDENEKYPLNNKKQNSLFNLTQIQEILNKYTVYQKKLGKMKSYDLLAEEYNCSPYTIMRLIKKNDL